MVENNKATTSALRRTCKKCGREIQPFETAYFLSDRKLSGPFCGHCVELNINRGVENEMF